MGEYGRGLSMASKRTEIAIERIIAACDGNMRGALEALLRVNEHLEAELHQLYAADLWDCQRPVAVAGCA
jgi:hypothetical protein